MLTFESIVKATQQMSTCGDVHSGALDHLPSRVTGFKPNRPSGARISQVADSATLVRRWNDEEGLYEYIEG